MTKQFSFSTVENFDEHIDKSIKGYCNLIDDTINISNYFVRDGYYVLDIGSSTGKMLSDMSRENTLNNVKNAKYIGYEIEKNFEGVSGVSKDRGHNLNFKFGDVLDLGLQGPATFVTSIFTLQFMSYSERQRMLHMIYNTLEPGGGFISAEKVFSETARVQDIKSSLYYQYKALNFETDEILSKERDLRSMMNLKRESEVINDLRDVGFTQVETFWKNYNFVGFLGIK